MTCVKCGGAIIGDGYSVVMHCEHAIGASYEFHESDADAVYCDHTEDAAESS